MLEIYSFSLMLLVFVSYVAIIWAKYGVLPSISDSYYVLPGNWKIFFTIFCWAFAFPAIIAGGTALMFLAGAGIAFVGAAAAFQEKLTKTVHYAGAIWGVLFSQLSICIDFHLYPITIGFVLLSGLLYLLKVKNLTWWVELLAFSAISIALGIITF